MCRACMKVLPTSVESMASKHIQTESFMPHNTIVKENLECKVNNVRKWITENHLKMNDSKTDFMAFGTRYNLDRHTIPSLKVGDSDIINNKNIKFLGVTLDPHLTFNDHIDNTSQIALYSLSLIPKIRNFFTADQLKMVMCSFVFTQTILMQYL